MTYSVSVTSTPATVGSSSRCRQPKPQSIPRQESGRHELYLMCDDLKSEMAALTKKGVHFSAIEEARWGSITKLRLPSGAEIGLYQPKHPTAI